MDGFIIEHKCYECGWQGDVVAEGRRITCPLCGTENDIWLEGEEPPERHRGDQICIRVE